MQSSLSEPSSREPSRIPLLAGIHTHTHTHTPPDPHTPDPYRVSGSLGGGGIIPQTGKLQSSPADILQEPFPLFSISRSKALIWP